MRQLLLLLGIGILVACSSSSKGKADLGAADVGPEAVTDLGQSNQDSAQPPDLQGPEGQDLPAQGEVVDMTEPKDTAQPKDTQDVFAPPPGHTENMGGVWHKPGKEDPKKNCTSCHGADLASGVKSCYDCHNANDHTKVRGGVKHKDGQSSTCTTCHGPNNSGGLGPACSKCH